jgi:segregation and condensation protein B
MTADKATVGNANEDEATKAIDLSLELDAVVEAILLAVGKPLTVDHILAVFDEMQRPERQEIRAALARLKVRYHARGIQLNELASGFRFQTNARYGDLVAKLWEEKPQKYSRALLETLALIAYRQPITRAEIEDIRGVSVSSQIIRTLLERNWVRVIGHREVPGRPSIFATTKAFLDYFNLRSLDDLPPLTDLRDIDVIAREVSQQLELDAFKEESVSQTEAPEVKRSGSDVERVQSSQRKDEDPQKTLH